MLMGKFFPRPGGEANATTLGLQKMDGDGYNHPPDELIAHVVPSDQSLPALRYPTAGCRCGIAGAGLISRRHHGRVVKIALNELTYPLPLPFRGAVRRHCRVSAPRQLSPGALSCVRALTCPARGATEGAGVR